MNKAGWMERRGVFWTGGVAAGMADDATVVGAVVSCTVRTAGGEATSLSRVYATTVMVLVPGARTNDFVSICVPGSEGMGAIVWPPRLPPRFVTALSPRVSVSTGAALSVQRTLPIPPP